MNDSKITVKEKIILAGIVFIPIIMLVSWVFFKSLSDKTTDKDVYLNYEINIECIGKIDSIYRLKMNHNTLTLKVSGNNFYVPPNWENKFKIGDSISKKQGRLTVEHYRNNNLLEILDYNDIVKNME